MSADADRQKYCFKPTCRHASEAASQRRWLSEDGNGDTFRGPDQVKRVQEWRRNHPGYWKRKRPPSHGTQPVDIQRHEPHQSSCNAPASPLPALQDDWIAQHPAFVGLISMVAGSTLQEDIEATTRQVLLRGRHILGFVFPPTTTSRPHLDHDPQTSVAAGSAAPDPPELQLGGPSPGSPRAPSPR